MSSLNLEQDEPAPAKKKNNRNLKIFLGIGALIAVPAIGTTLAANITVNGGSVQFGQGISQAVACDPLVTITPSSAFTNADDSVTATSSFKLSQIALSAVDNSSGGCLNKTFTIRAYSNTAASAAQTITTGTDGTKLQFSYTGSVWDTTTANGAQGITVTSSSSTAITVTLPAGAQPSAGSINKFTIETS
jgi:hypothetical protein